VFSLVPPSRGVDLQFVEDARSEGESRGLGAADHDVPFASGLPGLAHRCFDQA
jgi:hypothetical protein